MAKKAGAKAGNGRRRKPRAKAPDALVPQPHGGAIYNGPGSPPGPGRPPSALRQRLRDAGDQRISVLEEIADGIVRLNLAPKPCSACGHVDKAATPEEIKAMIPSPADRRAAVDTLLKYGLGEKSELTVVHPDVRARLERMIGAIRASAHVRDAEALLRELSPIWSTE